VIQQRAPPAVCASDVPFSDDYCHKPLLHYTEGKSTRTRTIKASSVKEFLKKKQSRTAANWFKEVLAHGKKKKVYCEMDGATVTVQEKRKKVLTVIQTIEISPHTSIQMHGYDLFLINPDSRWHLTAESEEVCLTWFKELRATFIELCDTTIELGDFQNEESVDGDGANGAEGGGAAGADDSAADGAASAADADTKALSSALEVAAAKVRYFRPAPLMLLLTIDTAIDH
jgi:hypothetical protein